VGSTLTFVINTRQLWREGTANSSPPVDGSNAKRQWVLLLAGQRRGKRIGASPIMWPETLEQTAIRLDRESRSRHIQLGATPGGSVMITMTRPKRSQMCHRPRLVV
jgi:hypothetical protein